MPHVETINNADAIKLLRCDRSSDTRAFFFLYYYLFYILFEFNLTVVRGRRSREGRMKTEEKTQVSEEGFEPGTFRSCVAHSIHYATETPPIPDVLLVLVAPKYINRNVTTTLQSRFTPTPPHRPHSRALFYFILFYFILFYFILFYFILFYFILFYFCETSQYLALFAEVRTLPIFQHFSSKSLSFNMADLAQKWFFSIEIPIF